MFILGPEVTAEVSAFDELSVLNQTEAIARKTTQKNIRDIASR